MRTETAKTLALLAYLVSNPGPQPRHRLMGLLWGEIPEARARRNLRRALWNLRRQLSSPDQPPPILSDRQTVCFHREADYWADVEAFEIACAGLDPALPTPALLRRLDQARRASALYQGEFLEGFYVSGAPVFEEWVLAERERLRAMALRALEHMVAGCAAQNDTGAALQAARRLLALEPWLEEAHRWVMLLLSRTGRRAEALAQYEASKRTLAEELGVEPARETQELADQIRAGALETRASNLPAATTPFVGRVRELQEIAALLLEPDCRLLTVTGLGGVGKSRLAREVGAAQTANHAHGVHYVNLDAVAAPSRLGTAIAQSMDLVPVTGTDPESAVLTYLRERQLLLILDGFERLLDTAPLLTEVLEAGSGIKILVTSRQRLNLREEWVYPLDGLRCVPEEHDRGPGFSDAARLFMQTARRVSLGFQVSDEEHQHLSRICNVVGGLPLAIELASAWVRLLPLEAIADQIGQHPDFLGADALGSPERHRSIRAVFDYSWRFLSDLEREAFRRLSVFRGTFGPEEARQVCSASLSILCSLVDQSLVQRTASGRFQIHELLRHYAHEQLAQDPNEWESVHNLHCETYAASITAHRCSTDRVAHREVVRAFALDKQNVLAAWQWALRTRNSEAVATMCQGLADVCQLLSSFREGQAVMREALDVLGWPEAGTSDAGPEARISWELLSVEAMFSVYLGQLSQAASSLELCLAAFARNGLSERVAHCQFFLGEIARFRGERARAASYFRESRAGYESIGDRAAVGFCLNGLGLISVAQGQLDEARGLLQGSLAAFTETGHEMGQAIAGINLADLLIKLGDHNAAQRVLDRAHRLCAALGHRWGIAVCLRYLGDIAIREDRPADGKSAYLEGFGLLEDIGHRQAMGGWLVKLADVSEELGEYAEARRHLSRALSIAAELDDTTQSLQAATSLASTLAAEGDREFALLLAILAAREAPASSASRQRASQLAAGLADRLPAATVQRIRHQSTETTLEGVLAEWVVSVGA